MGDGAASLERRGRQLELRVRLFSLLLTLGRRFWASFVCSIGTRDRKAVLLRRAGATSCRRERRRASARSKGLVHGPPSLILFPVATAWTFSDELNTN